VELKRITHTMFGQLAKLDYEHLTNGLATPEAIVGQAMSPIAGLNGQTPIFSFPANDWNRAGDDRDSHGGPQSSSMASSTAFSNAGSFGVGRGSFLDGEDPDSDRFEDFSQSLLQPHHRTRS
jgi:hypothetical protein